MFAVAIFKYDIAKPIEGDDPIWRNTGPPPTSAYIFE